jgi:hypothetical protein
MPTATEAPAQNPTGAELTTAAQYNPNPLNVEAELADLIGSASSDPSPSPEPPAQSASDVEAPAAANTEAPAQPAPAAEPPSGEDDLPNRFRINLAKLPDDESRRAAKLLKQGNTWAEINAILAAEKAAAAPKEPPAAEPPSEQQTPADPLAAAEAAVNDLAKKLTEAKANLDYEAEAKLTVDLQRAILAHEKLQEAARAKEAESRAQLEQVEAKTAEEVFALYPELATEGSDFHLKSLEIHRQNISLNRPVVQDPAYLRILADETARQMGLAPRIAPPQPSGAPAPAANVPPPALDPSVAVKATNPPPRSANPNAPAPAPAVVPTQSPRDATDALLQALIGNDPLAEAYRSVG